MKFNILKPALAALVLVGTACTANYLDINTNPYEPSEDDMQTDGYIIGSALTSLAGTGGPRSIRRSLPMCCWAAPWVGIIPRRVALPVRS